MSIVVAVKKEGEIAIAADSLSSCGSLMVRPQYKVNHKKVYRAGKSWVGLVGWSALGNVFEHLLVHKKDVMAFSDRAAIFESLLKIHKTLKETYFVETSEDDDQPVESNQIDGLVISQKGIFSFCSYRNVNEYERFWAIGSGRDFALGAMHACYKEKLSARKIAEKGVLAGCEFNNSCGAPVQVKMIKVT